MELLAAPRGAGQAAEVFQWACSVGVMAFGSPACYIEAVVARPRHIEVRLTADQAGRVVCLSECSIQRRHQKIIGEALSPVITIEDREKMFASAMAIVKKMGYVGAGSRYWFCGRYAARRAKTSRCSGR